MIVSEVSILINNGLVFIGGIASGVIFMLAKTNKLMQPIDIGVEFYVNIVITSVLNRMGKQGH